jgi:hypothetical protein
MIKLFKLDEYEVVVEPEAILLKPFKTLWDRDKRRDKSLAKQEFAFIFFVSDPRSDYQYIIDREEREKQVIQALGMPEGWKPDKKVYEAIVFYESFKPVSAGLLEDTRVAVDKLRQKLRNINLDETDRNGKPVHTLSSMTQTIKQIPALVKELDEAERTLNKDIIAEARARGSQRKALFEDED